MQSTVIPTVILIAFYAAVLAAYFGSIRYLVDIIQMEGNPVQKRWPFYFIGVFATPIILGLIACAIPDKS